MSGAIDWVSENVFGQEKQKKEDPTARANSVDPNSGEYGGQGGHWEPAPDGTPGSSMHDFGNGVSANARWVPSVGDQTAQKFSDTSNQYREGGAADYAHAEEDRRRGLEARGGQQAMAEQIAARARGETPSIAEAQAQRDAGRLAAEQSSIAAGARGPAGLALAQQNQANASATGQSAISQQAQINAMGERERAEQAAFGAYSGMRQGDQGAFQGNSGQGGQKGQLGLGYSQLENSVRQSQQQGATNREALRTGQYNASAARNQEGTNSNNASNMAVAGGIMGAFSSGAGTIFSDERAKRGISPISSADFIGHTAPMAQSTWGTGSGMSESATDDWQRANVDEHNAYEAGQKAADKALSAETGPSAGTGPMAVAGVNGAGQFVQPDVALSRRDDERQMELRGKREHGQELDDREQTELRVLNRRAGEEERKNPEPDQKAAKEKAKKTGISDFFSAMGNNFKDMGKEGARNIRGGGGNTAYMPQLIGPPSDERAKNGAIPMSGLGAVGGHSAYDDRDTGAVLGDGGGGMDVKGTLAKYADMSSAFQPMGGPGGNKMGGRIVSDVRGKMGVGDMLSDMSSKVPVYSDEKAKTNVSSSFAAKLRGDKQLGDDYGALPLANPGDIDPSLRESGLRLAVNDEGRAGYKQAPITASLSSTAQRSRTSDGGSNGGAPGAKPKAASATGGGGGERKPTLDEASKWADRETAKTKDATARIESEGPSVKDDQAPAPWLSKYMLSDDRAKLALAESKAYALGRAHQGEQADTGKPVPMAYAPPKAAVEDKNSAQVAVERAGRAVKSSSEQPQLKRLGTTPQDKLARGAQGLGEFVQGDVKNPSVPRPEKDEPPHRMHIREPQQYSMPVDTGPSADAERKRDAADRIADVVGGAYDWAAAKAGLHGYEGSVSDERAKHVIGHEQSMAEANRAQEGYAYKYKPGLTPPDQRPGETNVGPMAQEMAADPVSRTAVKKDPGTGLLTLDRDKMLKLHGAGLASVQKQLDELYRVLGRKEGA